MTGAPRRRLLVGSRSQHPSAATPPAHPPTCQSPGPTSLQRNASSVRRVTPSSRPSSAAIDAERRRQSPPQWERGERRAARLSSRTRREVEAREGAKPRHCSDIVSPRRLVSGCESADHSRLKTNARRNPRLKMSALRADAALATIAHRVSPIGAVFRVRAQAKIGAAIVETISIDMVDELAIRGSGDKPMQPHLSPSAPRANCDNRIVGLTVRAAGLGLPFAVTEQMDVLPIDKSDHPPR
ncbi:hypothetical protein EV560_106133 [Bosea sp. BK604]|nr:hypothetical protein EV560_106133 [Bosea sp. BK604]